MHYLELYRQEGHKHSNMIGPVIMQQDYKKPGSGINIKHKRFLIAIITSICLIILFLLPVLFTNFSWTELPGKVGYNLWCFGGGILGLILMCISLFSSFDVFQRNLNILGFHPFLLLLPVISRILQEKEKLKGVIYLHIFFIFPPIIGLLYTIAGINEQYCWPFLTFAVLIQGMIALRVFRSISR